MVPERKSRLKTGQVGLKEMRLQRGGGLGGKHLLPT